MLSGQVGILVGTVRISKLLYWLGAEIGSDFPQFKFFMDQVPASVPIANERLKWETEALLIADRHLADIELKFRGELMRACAQIIKTYG